MSGAIRPLRAVGAGRAGCRLTRRGHGGLPGLGSLTQMSMPTRRGKLDLAVEGGRQ